MGSSWIFRRNLVHPHLVACGSSIACSSTRTYQENVLTPLGVSPHKFVCHWNNPSHPVLEVHRARKLLSEQKWSAKAWLGEKVSNIFQPLWLKPILERSRMIRWELGWKSDSSSYSHSLSLSMCVYIYVLGCITIWVVSQFLRTDLQFLWTRTTSCWANIPNICIYIGQVFFWPWITFF